MEDREGKEYLLSCVIKSGWGFVNLMFRFYIYVYLREDEFGWRDWLLEILGKFFRKSLFLLV